VHNWKQTRDFFSTCRWIKGSFCVTKKCLMRLCFWYNIGRFICIFTSSHSLVPDPHNSMEQNKFLISTDVHQPCFPIFFWWWQGYSFYLSSSERHRQQVNYEFTCIGCDMKDETQWCFSSLSDLHYPWKNLRDVQNFRKNSIDISSQGKFGVWIEFDVTFYGK
jgi:hypothetical protein